MISMLTLWFGFVGLLAGIGAGAIFQWLTYFGFQRNGPPPKGAPFQWRYLGPALFAITMLGAWFATILVPLKGDDGFVFMAASFVGLGLGLYLGHESQYWRLLKP